MQIIRRAVFVILLLCGGAALSLGQGAPAAADPPPFDVDFLHCGQVACANVYQGEGISHPQLVVQITRTAGLGTTYTYIYDFPPDDSGTISFYIGSHLAQRIGGENAVSLDPQDLAELLPDADVLAEGVQLALFAPDTFDLGLWPSNPVLEELVVEAVDDIPGEIFDWDAENGFGPQGGGGGGTPGGDPPTPSQQAADDLTVDPCLMFGSCEPLGPAPGLGLAAPGLGPRPGPTLLLTPIPQILTPIPQRTRRALARARATVQTISPGGLDQLADPGRTEPIAQGQMCSKANLEGAQSLNQCRDRCDSCDQMWEQAHNVAFAVTCADAFILGGIALAPKTAGLSYVGSVALAVLGGSSGCGWLATTFTATHRAALHQACRNYCEFIWTGGYPAEWSDTE